jgi:hypothetical protein
MLYAVTIEPLNGIYFVSDRPDECDWEVQEGVELEVTPIFGTWTPDRGPLREFLCVSKSNPKYYRVIRNSKEIESLGYRLTGRRFGGLFPKAAWERFAKIASSSWILRTLGDVELTEATQEVVGAIRSGA